MRTRPSLPAAGLTLLAAAALAVSMAGPTFLALVGEFDVSFASLRTLTSLDSAPAIQNLYFGWLAWILTIIVIVALLATVVLSSSVITRVTQGVVFLLSAAGLVLTLLCVQQLSNQDPSNGFFDHFGWIRLGGYLHVVGWVLAIIAAVYAPRGAAPSRSDA
ncbi:MAG: hypothetical protein WKF79_02915 [Nocardioides sp.]